MPKLTGIWVPLAAFGGFFLVLLIVFKVLDTEFFRGDPDLGGSATPARNEKTALAHAFCAQTAIERLAWNQDRARSLPDYTAWDLGFDRYLVQAMVENSAEPGQGQTYLCKVLNQGGGSAAGDWAVQSVEFHR